MEFFFGSFGSLVFGTVFWFIFFILFYLFEEFEGNFGEFFKVCFYYLGFFGICVVLFFWEFVFVCVCFLGVFVLFIYWLFWGGILAWGDNFGSFGLLWNFVCFVWGGFVFFSVC